MNAAYTTCQRSPDEAADALEDGLQAAIRALETGSSLAHQLLDAAPVQIVVLDRSLIVRWTNAAFAQARKLVRSSLPGRPVTELLGELGTREIHFRRTLEGESAHFVIRTPTLPDSTMRDLNVYLRPLHTPQGEIAGLCMYIGDLRVLNPSQEKIPTTAEALRQVFGSIPNYVFVLDREMRILFANRGVRNLRPEELEGRHITDAFPPKLHATVLSALHRVLQSGQLDGFTAELNTDGQLRHFDTAITPVRIGGQIIALTMIGTETTEQVRAERAIATQARMIESMLEGVAVVNEQGLIEITNPAFDRMFGYDRGGLIGRDMTELTDGAFAQRGRWPLAPGTTSTTIEFEALRRDGTMFAAAGVLSRFEIAGRNHSLIVLQDVSERKQLERAILLAVNREQYRIGNDLHDGLGQELTGIALMLRGVAGRLTTEYPAILPEIESITKLVSNAIENTRALARGLSPVNLERGGLQDALEGLAMNAFELYGVQVSFSHRIQGSKPLGAELANHLYRIAQEAIRNAVRHGQARTIRLHLRVTRGKVSLAITDDGIGLPERAMDATGMGLKIMRYRARMLGGELHFERVEPTGTRIVCECPIERDDQGARPKARRKTKRSTSNGPS